MNLTDTIKASISLKDLAEQAGLQLISEGREYKAKCPFHVDKTASLFINEKKGVFNCFGCNAAGSVIDFYKLWQGIKDDKTAINELKNRHNLKLTANPPPKQDDKRDEALKQKSKTYAKHIFDSCRPLNLANTESPIIQYLSQRNINIPPHQQDALHHCIREGELVVPKNFVPEDTGYTKCAALVGGMIDNKKVVACQRIFIKDKQKAFGKASKLSLGVMGGGLIPVWKGWQDNKPLPPLTHDNNGMLLITEGIEDALSLAILVPHYRIACGAGLKRLKNIIPPKHVIQMTFACDNPKTNDEKQLMDKAVLACKDRGIAANQIHPPAPYKDFNEYLVGRYGG